MRVVNLLIKPASSECNLRCQYCFYHDIASNRSKKSFGKMSLDTLEILIEKACLEAEEALILAFQGGESMLVGLKFYQELIRLVEKYNQKKLIVRYSIQTNGTFIDDIWSRFFKENNFLVGISLDGDKKVHDSSRYDHIKSGSFDKVMKAITHLKKARVDFNILSVVTNQNSQHIQKAYSFFQEEGFHYLQFIPCLAPIGEEQALTLSKENYFTFLDQLFECYYQDLLSGKMVSIRYFDNLIGMLLRYEPQSCDLRGICSYNLVVESNGDLYPCDFYVLDQCKLGNITTDSLASIYQDKKWLNFLHESCKTLEKCKKCAFYALCRGGCKRHRQNILNGELFDNVFCESYYHFLSKNIRKLEHLASIFSRKIE